MINELVTIVLPIYNVEKYLERCLKSVINQTYSNLEIILVDDGSPDSCPRICDEWAKKDARIKVIHKQNEGLGFARNTGIENATGNFILFIDSDDYIELNLVEECYKEAINHNADIILFGLNKIDKNGHIIEKKELVAQKYIYKGNEIINQLLPDIISNKNDKHHNINLPMTAWSGMYSMDMIRKATWRFVSEREIIAEDIYSLLNLYYYAQKVVIIPTALYNYCFNEQSLTHIYKKDKFSRIKYFYQQSVIRSLALGYSQEIIERLKYVFISFTIATLKLIVHSNYNIKEKRDAFKKIVADELLLNILESFPQRNESFARKILYWALKNNHINLAYFLVSLKN